MNRVLVSNEQVLKDKKAHILVLYFSEIAII